jgi:protoporphyrinogen oxidase
MQILSIFIAFVARTAVATKVAQLLLDLHSSECWTAHDGRKRVAVIGAGTTAASLAYRLYDEYGSIVPLDITVHETTSQVGGRINTGLIDNRANGYAGFVGSEAGLFSADDFCLLAAINDAGLRRKVVEVSYPKRRLVFGTAKRSLYIDPKTLN